jgi:uncharacterized SAM-binding protein YcdF (DUF218 family)
MLPSRHARWRQAAAGASLGLLAATAMFVLGIPGVTSRHATAWILFAAIVGALVLWLDWTRGIAYVATGVALFTAVVTLTPILNAPVRTWIRRDSLPATSLDAVMVLSSSVNPDGAIDVSGVERLLAGLALFRRNQARLLVTSRVENREHTRAVTSDADQRMLIALGADTSHWRIIAPVRTTHDEALRTAQLLAPANARTIAVVTSPLHTRRACATFEGVGFHVVCVPSEERVYAVHSLSGPADRLRAFFDLLYERLGMIEYRARGWVRPK